MLFFCGVSVFKTPLAHKFNLRQLFLCHVPISTVIWNPWKEKAQGMSDFGDDEVSDYTLAGNYYFCVYSCSIPA